MNNKMIKQTTALMYSAAAAMLVSACSSSSDFDFEQNIAAGRASIPLQAAYDPANGVIPFPNNLLFTGSMDGTLNIPLTNPDGSVTPDDTLRDPRVALNALDGFSTTESFAADFGQSGSDTPSQGLDPSTLVIGSTVRVFEVAIDPMTFIPTDIITELTIDDVSVSTDALNAAESEALARANAAAAGIEFDEASVRVGNPARLVISPVTPLKESTTYMVVVLGADLSTGVPVGGVRDTTGRPISAPATFTVATGSESLAGTPLEFAEPLRAVTRPMIDLLASSELSSDLNVATVALAWNATTQSTTPVLNAAAAAVVSRPITIQPTGFDTTAAGVSPENSFADIWAGFTQVPDYIGIDAPLSNFWNAENGGFLTRFNPVPQEKGLQNIPVIMTVPNRTDAPEGGWPVVIFQHGITRNRLDMLAIADTMARGGFATIAIDLPLHGIVEESPFRNAMIPERTFDIDVMDNATGAPVEGGDGQIDGSGTHFVNLTNLLNTLGNMRQSTSDLLNFSASLNTIPILNASNKAFIGHSLGAIVGTNFLAFDNTVTSATLASPGGSIARLLQNSPAFGPAINQGLSQLAPVTTAAGQQFLTSAQTVVDSADPINHAVRVTGNTSVHMTQMLQDLVVIGSQPEFPLVGTEPLARTMGLTQISTTSGGNGWVQFLVGDHGSIINPFSDPASGVIDPSSDQFRAFSEIQSQTLMFAGSGGANIVISDESLINAAP